MATNDESSRKEVPSASAGGTLFSVGLVADVPGRPVGAARLAKEAFTFHDLGILIAAVEIGTFGHGPEAQLVAEKFVGLVLRAFKTVDEEES